MRNRAARSASSRWTAAAPTTTATSPTTSVPTRCQTTTRRTPALRSAAASISAKIRSAIGRSASYRRARTTPFAVRSGRTRPTNTTIPPAPGSASARWAWAGSIGRAESATDTRLPSTIRRVDRELVSGSEPPGPTPEVRAVPGKSRVLEDRGERRSLLGELPEDGRDRHPLWTGRAVDTRRPRGLPGGGEQPDRHRSRHLPSGRAGRLIGFGGPAIDDTFPSGCRRRETID
jgi:hypothetical protein